MCYSCKYCCQIVNFVDNKYFLLRFQLVWLCTCYKMSTGMINAFVKKKSRGLKGNIYDDVLPKFC